MTPTLTRQAGVDTGQRSPAPPARLGFGASLLAAALTVGFVVVTLLSPADAWRGIDAYAASFEAIGVVQLVPVLLLAPAVVVLMTCIDHLVEDGRRVASHLAVTFAAIYTTIITVNYTLQLFVVRLNVAAGELEDLALLAMPNPRSVFTALEITGYGFFALMALAAGAAFSGGKLQHLLRYTFMAAGATGIAGATGGLADQPIVMLTGFGLSLLAFLAATALLAVHFRRLDRLTSAPTAPPHSTVLH